MRISRRSKGVNPSACILRAIAVLYLFPSMLMVIATASRDGDVQTGTHVCDVLIAGGSLASAAAAVAAAASSSNSTRVCFLEITDWPGGQASAGGDPAMDFGLQYLNFPHNIPQSLAELLTDGRMGGPDYNPGECHLAKCFPPEWAAKWLLDRLAAAPNMAVFLNTTVVGVDRDAAGKVTRLRAVQRTPTARHPSGYDRPLSQALPDWYSPNPSAYFDKAQLHFVVAPTGVVVEATEFGDVLVLADGVGVGQGIELGAENSTEYDEYCGNPAAFSVLAEWGTEPLPPTIGPAQIGATLTPGLTVRRYWTQAKHTPRKFNPYHSGEANVPPIAPGDHYVVTSDCYDLKNANVFLPLDAARKTARAGTWAGGMNLSAIAKAEAQAWACFQHMQNGSLSVRPEESKTASGMSKMMYLRESRRSLAGVGGFRLCHNIMSVKNIGPGGAGCSTAADPPGQNSSNSTGYRFFDTVAIGAPQPNFGYDVHHPKPKEKEWCRLPPYVRNKIQIRNSTVPFFFPFRALTVADAPNMLVAGKSLAQSFLTSSVTRLHPNEWSSGTAAGVAAAMMSALNLSSVEMTAKNNIFGLQARLRSLGAPLQFNLTFA